MCLVLGLSLVEAHAVTRDERCEMAIRDIASALASGKGNDVVSRDFPARESLLSSTDPSSGSPVLKLEVLNISDVKFPTDSTCSARVEIKASKAGEKSSANFYTFFDNWTVRMATAQNAENDEPGKEDWLIGSHVGKVMLQVHMMIPPGTRDQVLSSEEAINDGLKPSSWNEDAVMLPVQPAAGWYARLGSQMTMISEDGEFSLNLDTDEDRGIEILNPAQGQVYATFSIEKLKQKGQGEPESLVVDLVHYGGCGMGPGHGAEPPWCESLPGLLNR